MAAFWGHIKKAMAQSACFAPSLDRVVTFLGYRDAPDTENVLSYNRALKRLMVHVFLPSRPLSSKTQKLVFEQQSLQYASHCKDRSFYTIRYRTGSRAASFLFI